MARSEPQPMESLKTKAKVKKIIKVTAQDRRYIKRYRKLGMGDHEIAKALGLPEDSLLFAEGH